MIRTIPFGISKGQIIRPMIASIMTNNLTAKAKVRYNVVICYPGGVIIEPVDDPLEPRGLLKAGTPVHVEGEPEPTPEELAPYVMAGNLPSSFLGAQETNNSDAADFAAKPKATLLPGAYRIDPAKRLAAPRQAAIICDVLVESGQQTFQEWEIIGLLAQHRVRLNTRQDVKTVFKYYKSRLVEAGFLSQ